MPRVLRFFFLQFLLPLTFTGREPFLHLLTTGVGPEEGNGPPAGVVRLINGLILLGTDGIRVYDAADSTQLPLGDLDLSRADYVGGLLGGETARFGATGTASQMAASGNSLTITLGTHSGQAAHTTAASDTMSSGSGHRPDRPRGQRDERRGRRRVRRRGSGVLMASRLGGVVLVALAAGSLAIALARERSDASPKPVASASGAMSSNSLDGQAILSASGIGPGDSANGQVTISNSGDAPGELTLVQRLGSAQAGTGGGSLYDRLALEVRRIAGSGGAPAALLYSGPVSAMGSAPVGRFEPGAYATYSFVVSFSHGAADDAAQGASVSLDYEWLAADAPPDPPAATRGGRRHTCRFGMVGTPEPDSLATWCAAARGTTWSSAAPARTDSAGRAATI